MLSHDYIKNDFDVQECAAPEFLELPSMEPALGCDRGGQLEKMERS